MVEAKAAPSEERLAEALAMELGGVAAVLVAVAAMVALVA